MLVDKQGCAIARDVLLKAKSLLSPLVFTEKWGLALRQLTLLAEGEEGESSAKLSSYYRSLLCLSPVSLFRNLLKTSFRWDDVSGGYNYWQDIMSTCGEVLYVLEENAPSSLSAELTPYCPSFPPVREGEEEGYFYPPPGGGIYKWSISYWESLEPMFFPTGLYEEKSTVEIFDEKNLRNASPYVEEPTAFAVAPMLDPMHGVFWKGPK